MALTHAHRSPVSPIFLGLVAAAVVGAVLTVGQPPDPSPDVPLPPTPLVVGGTILLILAGWAVSLCLHEFGHAITAYRLGDASVKAMGYLTLDIRRYANIGMTLILPLLFLLIGGIPLPGGAVWIQRGALRSRLSQSAVSIAGPAVNLVLTIALVLVVQAVPMPPGLQRGLSALALIQMLTCVLNLIPIPGLDGFGVIDPYLPYRVRYGAARIAPFAPLVILVLLFVVPGAGQVVFGPAYDLFGSLGGNIEDAGRGMEAFSSLLRR